MVDHNNLEDTSMMLAIKIERKDGDYILTVGKYVLESHFDTISRCVKALIEAIYQACLENFTTLGTL